MVVFENKAIVKLQKTFAIAKKWVYENDLNFDLRKFKAIYFSKKQNLPSFFIQLWISKKTELVIILVPKSSSLHWPRLYYNSRLLFINYVEKIAVKGYLIATGLYMFTKNT